MTPGTIPDIRRVALIGCGVMGRQVAWACARAGIDVHFYDHSAAVALAARDQVSCWLHDEKSFHGSGRVVVHAELRQAVREAELVFENVPEDVAVKGEIHARIERHMPPGAIQGSNSSVITCSAIAEALTHSERLFCMNFSHARSGERLVEFMRGRKTGERTRQLALRWASQIGMVAIEVRKEIPGYIQNRIWRAIKKEALTLVAQGYATAEDVDRGFMLSWGTPVGPFGLMDKVGLASVLNVEKQYQAVTGDPSDEPPELLVDMVSQGLLGEQSGKGFYSYPDPAYEQPGWLGGRDNDEASR